jgi:hypothetical protein
MTVFREIVVEVAEYGWSERQARVAAELWLKGMSASNIAESVGKTRNAVIGKANREKWPREAWPARTRRTYKKVA